jgi:hypothetical protein
LKVSLGSMVRDGAHYSERWVSQCASLRDALQTRGDTLKVYLCEGDSVDRSREMFTKYANGYGLDFTLLTKNHGGPAYGSVVDLRRFTQKAMVGNYLLDSLEPTDAFIYVECDLVWDSGVMCKLLDHLANYPAISPMCMSHPGVHYDIWGLTIDNESVRSLPPYHEKLNGITKVTTTGSCVAMRGELVANPKVRFSPVDEFHGLSRAVYEVGGAIYVDPSLQIRHP